MSLDHRLMRDRLLSWPAAVLCMATFYVGSAVAATDDLHAQIAMLRAEQARIVEMQRQIDAKLYSLELQLGGDPGTPAVATTTPSVSAASVAADAQPRLNVTGDLRLRSQGDYSDTDARDRTSAQVRARLGATYVVNDSVRIGARLVTGDPDDPNSTDVQLSNFDDDLQVSLDLAYVGLDFGDLQLFGGKIPLPFTRTDLVWDSDVNPQGASAIYKVSLANGTALRVNGLFFIVDEQSDAADSTMKGAQVGYDSAAQGDWRYELSAAYYDYRLGSTAGGDSGDFRSNLRNPDGSYLSDFNLGDVVAGVTWSGAGERWPLRATADYVHNFGAETRADTGYAVDLALGRANQANDWRVTYGYSVAETDSVLAAFSNDNIGIGTNYRLHALTLDYVPWPKTLISAIWYHYQPYDAADAGANAPGDWLDRVRLAFLVSF
jgi:hypothetical protein